MSILMQIYLATKTSKIRFPILFSKRIDELFHVRVGHWIEYAIIELLDEVVNGKISILLACLLVFQKHLTIKIVKFCKKTGDVWC